MITLENRPSLTDRDMQELVVEIRDFVHGNVKDIIESMKADILNQLRKEIEDELESRILYELKQIRSLLEK